VLAVIFLLAGAGVWAEHNRKRYQAEVAAIAALADLVVEYEMERSPNGPEWFPSVVVVVIEGVADADLRALHTLVNLRDLWILNSPRVTDTGLRHLGQLGNLRELILSGTQVTQDGVDRLKRSLPNVHVMGR